MRSTSPSRNPRPRAAFGPPLTGLLSAVAAAIALLASAASAATGPALMVDASADRRPIAPEIYGMSFADPTVARQLRLPLNRWGGNHTDRYNWRIDTWNTGADWFFENVAGCWPDCSAAPADPSRGYRRIVDGDRATGAGTLLTLPMVGWVAKEARYAQPLPCSFPRALFPTQRSYDPWNDVCGDGLPKTGTGTLTADPATANVRAGHELSAAWLADIVARYGRGAVRWYGLGNEPALWSETHRDVHPAPTTSGELLSRSIALATVVKDADPAARTVGFSEWGWPHYFRSAAEEHGRPDPAKPAGAALAGWFLDGMRAASEAQGRRLLDYFDLHYYQQEGEVADGASTEVTRSLWDPTYVDRGWIGQTIRLLPRMRAWVDAHYPGTKLALSEYDLSIGDPLIDTLIQADTLGIFAREGVDMAVRWGPPGPGDPGLAAFRLYRDYDGAGARFGETWVRSVSADQSRVAVYGAQRAADGALTVALVNKSPQPQASPLTLAGVSTEAGTGRTARAWRWSAAAPSLDRAADVALSDGGATTLDLPARSLTLLVVPAGTTTPQDGGGSPAGGGGGGRGGGGAPGGGVPGGGVPGARRRPTRCLRRSTLTLRLRSPTGRRIRSARVVVGGRRARGGRRLSGRRLRRPVVLRKLPRGRFTVTIHLRLAGERGSRVVQRRYERCR